MSYFADQHGVSPIYIEQMSRELSHGDIVSLWKIYRHIVRERPDVIHTHTAKAGTLGRTAAFAYRWLTPAALVGRPRAVKVIHTFHGHVFHSYYTPRKTSLFRMIERVLARVATDRIVVISSQQLREINGENGIGLPEQFRVIPLGLDLRSEALGHESDLRTEVNASPDELVIAFVGRLTEIKDIPLLLAAFSNAVAQEGPKLRLAIIGDGSLREALETEAARLKISTRVAFLGNRQDVGGLIADADIVALTSLNEGTPLSLIEAMALGRPVISTTVGGVIDLLGSRLEDKDGFVVYERGIGVSSREPADIAKGLIYLAKNERLRKSLGSAGQAFVRENYSIERLERDITSLYRELVPNDS
jgi:glycosyltransferase involved in cell wall biosynthesis